MKSLSHSVTRFFPTPRMLLMPAVGIAVSLHSIRGIDCARAKGLFVPRWFFDYSIAGAISPDTIAADGELKKVLQKIKNQYRISYANVSLPEEKAYIFRTELPAAALENVHQAVAYKIEENVPLDPASAVYDVRVLPHHPYAQTVPVVVTVVPKEVTEAYLAAFDAVGISVLSFQTANQALANALVAPDDSNVYVMINADDGKADISLVKDGAVQYSTTVFSTGEEIVERIREVVLYWETHMKLKTEAASPQVLLAGKEARNEALFEMLSQKLTIPVKYGNVWANCFSLDQYVPKISRSESLAYGVAVGLALNSFHSHA